MATNYIAPTWRMPENTNKDKLSNYSLEFNGTNEYIDFPQTDFKGGSGTVSYSFWVKPATYGNPTGTQNYGYFISNSSTGGGIAYSEGGTGLGLTPGQVYIYNMTNAGAVATLTSTFIDENVWNNIIVVFNTGNIVQFYKNGILSSTLTGITSFNSTWDTIAARRYSGGVNNELKGNLSEFSIFNYALGESQVTYLYNLNNPMAITGAKPVAYWPLGDNSNPRALAGYPNLSVGGSVFNFIPNDHIELGNNSSLSLTSQLSVSAWVKDTGTSAGAFPTIIGNVSTSANKGGWILAKNLNKWKFYLDTTGNSGWAVAESNGTVVVNSWQHLCATWDGSTVIMYLNGQAQTTTASASQIVYLADTTTAIGEYRAGTDYFGGEMSNIALLDTALTPAQVTTLYNNGAPGDISSLSPIAWYKLDSSEIFNSTSTEWSVDNNAYPSVYKSSLNFNGSSDTINLSNNSVFNLGTSFTISGWFNFSSNKYQGLISFDAASGGSPRGWFLFQIDTNNDIRLFDGTTVFTLKTSYTTTNQWDSFIITYDGTDLVFYINGNQESTQAVSVDLQTNGNDAQIGNNQFASGRFFDGEMSNIALWNVGLTPTQVATIYNNGTPETSISHSPVSWYKLDNTTTGVQDSAGSNNGTNNGATEYAGFVNGLAGESSGMDSSNLVQSDLYRTTPYSNYSINFDSPSGDYFNFNNASSNIMANKNTLSISAWFKLDSNTISTVVSNWYGGGLSQYLIRYNTGANLGIQWYVKVGSTAHRIDSNYYPNVGDWVHVVGVKDPITNGGQIRVYINTLEYSLDDRNISNRIFSNNGSDQIGVFNNASNFMDGSISNVAYWTNTALTQSEVTEIYNSGVTTNLSNFSGTAPDHWCPLDGKKVYYNGSVIVARDAIGTLQATGVNLVQENIVGNAPGSNSNGTGFNLDILDLKGDMSNSTKNAKSINMADYGDPNAQGVTPADSGRTTSVPG